MYVLTGLGITIGYHRLLTHRSFADLQAGRVRCARSLGSMAVQGPVIAWVADHRKHHAHTDEEGDPHSPARRPRRRRPGRAARALVRAHGLAVRPRTAAPTASSTRATWSRTAGCARSTASSSRSSLLGLLIPAALGYLARPARSRARSPACSGAASCASSCSTTSPGRSTPSATSSARRRFDVEDHSTNVFWLALPSFGESWHHNHHAFPRSAVHGLRWWEVDASGVVDPRDEAAAAWRGTWSRSSPSARRRRSAPASSPPSWPRRARHAGAAVVVLRRPDEGTSVSVTAMSTTEIRSPCSAPRGSS